MPIRAITRRAAVRSFPFWESRTRRVVPLKGSCSFPTFDGPEPFARGSPGPRCGFMTGLLRPSRLLPGYWQGVERAYGEHYQPTSDITRSSAYDMTHSPSCWTIALADLLTALAFAKPGLSSQDACVIYYYECSRPIDCGLGSSLGPTPFDVTSGIRELHSAYHHGPLVPASSPPAGISPSCARGFKPLQLKRMRRLSRESNRPSGQ